MPRTIGTIGTAAGFPGAAASPPVDPAWQPWLDLLGIALEETGDPAWGSELITRAGRPSGAPLLHGAMVRVDARRARKFVRRLADAACIAGADEIDPAEAMRAAIARDDRAIALIAERLGVPAGSIAVLAQLAAMPLLHAAARTLDGGVARAWQRGYCPVCGAWPSLSEARGIERERRLRCGSCGADWPLPLLRCAFCDEMDHRRLGTLHPEGEGQLLRIDSCESCHGYLKSVTTLGALPIHTLVLKDLVTISLDLVAQDRGYARPVRPGWAMTIEVIA